LPKYARVIISLLEDEKAVIIDVVEGEADINPKLPLIGGKAFVLADILINGDNFEITDTRGTTACPFIIPGIPVKLKEE